MIQCLSLFPLTKLDDFKISLQQLCNLQLNFLVCCEILPWSSTQFLVKRIRYSWEELKVVVVLSCSFNSCAVWTLLSKICSQALEQNYVLQKLLGNKTGCFILFWKMLYSRQSSRVTWTWRCSGAWSASDLGWPTAHPQHCSDPSWWMGCWTKLCLGEGS